MDPQLDYLTRTPGKRCRGGPDGAPWLLSWPRSCPGLSPPGRAGDLARQTIWAEDAPQGSGVSTSSPTTTFIGSCREVVSHHLPTLPLCRPSRTKPSHLWSES